MDPLPEPSRTLQEPLLGIEPYELDKDDTVACDYGAESSDLGALHGDTNELDEASEITWSDTFVIWILVPVLLFAQCTISFMLQDDNSNESVAINKGPYWPVVGAGIVLFVISSWFYRLACKKFQINNDILVLLPEILMDIIILLCFFDKVDSAVVCMIGSILCLTLFAAISGIRTLLVGSSNPSDKDMRTATPSSYEDSRQAGFEIFEV